MIYTNIQTLLNYSDQMLEAINGLCLRRNFHKDRSWIFKLRVSKILVRWSLHILNLLKIFEYFIFYYFNRIRYKLKDQSK